MSMLKKILIYIDGREKIDFYKDNKEDRTLRDYLALDRTILANERTFLAWFRTSVSMIALSIAVIKFNLSDMFIFSAGIVFLILGIAIGVVGSWRYYRIRKRLEKI